jgi:hypothetical protein
VPTLAARAGVAFEQFATAQAWLRASIEFDLKEIERHDPTVRAQVSTIITDAEDLLGELSEVLLQLTALRRHFIRQQEGGAA